MKSTSTKTKTTTGDLSALEGAFATKNGGDALLAALEAWRASRSPVLADLIGAISHHVSGGAIENEQEWSKVASTRDARELGRLLSGVPSLTARFLPSAGQLLLGFQDDPRLSIAVATWALDPPTTSSSTYPFWTRSLEAVGRIGDTRAIPLLKKRLGMRPGDSQFWPKFYAALEKTQDKIEALPAPSSGGPRGVAIAELTAKVGGLSSVATSKSASAVSTPGREAAAKGAAAPEDEGPLLVQAATHFGAGRVVAGIDALIAHWRVSRMPAVADLVDRATRLLPDADLPLGMTVKEIDAAWSSLVASDPASGMPRLLRQLTNGVSSSIEQRVVALQNLDDDPRISRRLAEMSASRAVGPQRAQYWKMLWEVLARHRDVRTCEPVRRWFNAFTSTYWDHHRSGRRIIGEFLLDPASKFEGSWPLTLDAQETRDLAKVEAVIAKRENEHDAPERAFLDAIANDRKDSAPYLVYADWLSERNHPRGELIVLSSLKPSPAETKRIAALERTPYIHGDISDLGMRSDMHFAIASALHISGASRLVSWPVASRLPVLSAIEKLVIRTTHYGFPLEDFVRAVTQSPWPRLQRVTSDEVIPGLAPLAASGWRQESTKSFVRK